MNRQLLSALSLMAMQLLFFNSPASAQTFKDVNYAGDEAEAHRMDIYLPETGNGPYKVIVDIYGSAWFANNAKQAAFFSIGKPLVDAGFAVVCINHRSSGEAKFPAQLHDVKGAIRYLRANAAKYRLDTSFIGITGYSSGGHLSSLTGVTNGMKKRTVGSTTIDLEGTVGGNTDFASTVDAVVDWFGPVDMAHMENCQTVKDDKSPEAALIGGAPADNPDLVALISPITYVATQQPSPTTHPRFLVFHGDADNVVPHCQSESFAAALEKADRLERFVTVSGGQHGPVTFNDTTFLQMTQFFLKEASRQRIIEDGGTGDYKAVMMEAPTLPEHTIFVPQDLAPFGADRKLPVLVWGNGACANSPFEHMNFLNEIASHGYIVLATGNIPMTDEWYKGPMSRPDQQIESIDWIIDLNNNPNSPCYQKIDVENICVAGMSCGGLQTLSNCADPRIKTLMICNSGLFINSGDAMPNMPMPKKEKLNEIHTPVIYILGGKEDIAYGNGMDDFHRIQHVPACVANYPVGHGGTYRQPHGGEFTVAALAWLDWQLKGDKTAAKMFVGKNSLLSKREGWTLEKNKKFGKLK